MNDQLHEIPAEAQVQCADAVGIARAAVLLHAGEAVALPTETVYGLAADAFNASAVAKIFAIKERPLFDPLIVHVMDVAAARQIIADWPARAEKLAAKFWPGPLTLVLPKKNCIPDLVTAGLPHVAVRVPRHPVMQAVLRAFGGPLAAPSANRFGRISPTSAAAVAEELGGRVPLILDAGACEVGVESTIVSFVEAAPQLLRAGGIPIEQLEEALGEKISAATESTNRLLAPGQLASHYAPRKPLTLVAAARDIPVDDRRHAALLVFSQHEAVGATGFARVEVLSTTRNFTQAAARFFAALRKLDAGTAAQIFAIPLPEEGLGRAINDRLRRAAHRG